eukprot:1074182-Rhodomonas_salina.3
MPAADGDRGSNAGRGCRVGVQRFRFGLRTIPSLGLTWRKAWDGGWVEGSRCGFLWAQALKNWNHCRGFWRLHHEQRQGTPQVLKSSPWRAGK